jgi:DNA-binding transcriptional ArsR family regulator
MAKQACIPMLKALADETRWSIVRECLKKPRTVGELAERLQITQYNISKHIRILREAKILTTERHGKFVQCVVENSFRKCLAAGGTELDLGCCRFRF